MKLSIVTAMCGSADITRQWLHETVGRCTESPELVIVSNGSTLEEITAVRDELLLVYRRWAEPADWDILVKPEPLGSTKPLNLGLNEATGDIVACLHNDLMVKVGGWDQEILQCFERRPWAGVVGFHGSKALGADDIYQVPYEKHQLARGWSCSNMEDAEAHGRRTRNVEDVITLDGMALIARRQDLLDWGGFDERYIHHMYDHDLCLTALKHGRRNFLYPMIVRHISGQTANQPRYNDHLESLGIARDQEVHDLAHVAFYEKWKDQDMLPARIR